MSWTLTIPQVPPSGNILKRMHWARYTRLLENWFWWVRCASGFASVPPPTGKRRLTITRHGARPLDRDNLYASVKPVVDVLRPPKVERGVFKSGAKAGQPWVRHRLGHGLILEDDAAHLHLEVQQATLARGETPHLVLVLEDVVDKNQEGPNMKVAPAADAGPTM